MVFGNGEMMQEFEKGRRVLDTFPPKRVRSIKFDFPNPAAA